MWFEEEFRRVVARIARDLLHLYTRFGERLLRLDHVVRIRIRRDILYDPGVQLVFHVFPAAIGAELVLHHALQVVREAAGREKVGQPRREVGIRRRIGIVVLGRLLERLGTEEHGVVGVLPVRQWDESVLRQLGLAPVGDGDFRGALHVHPTVVGGKGVAGQILHHAAAFHATNPRAPAVKLERLADISRHRVRRVRPHVLLVIAPGRVFLEGELLHLHRLLAIGQASQRPRHREPEVTRAV